jgi:hypothetical protein
MSAREELAARVAELRIAELEAHIAKLDPFAKMGEWALGDVFDHLDLDASEVFDRALELGLLVPIPGGYDPEQHEDEYGGTQPGDPWYSPRVLPKSGAKP